MALFLTYEEAENPFIPAAKKISSVYVTENGGNVTVKAQHQMQIAVFQHGAFCKQAIWSPNWEEVGQRTFPSGFQFTVDENAPILPALFENAPLAATAMAYPLDAGHGSSKTFKTGARVDDRYFMNTANGIQQGLVSKIDDAELGAQDTNFAGIFATEDRTDSGYVKKLWCVAQSHSDRVNESMQALIRASAPNDIEASLEYGEKLAANSFRADSQVVGLGKAPHVTWKELFVDNAEMRKLQAAQRKHCAQTIVKTLKTCKLGTVANSTDAAQNLNALLESPELIEARRNCVDHVVSGAGDLAYLSEMTSLHAMRSGATLIREAPHLGPTILSGPWQVEEQATRGVIGFPYSVGRLCSVRQHNTDSRLSHEDLVQSGSHVWNAAAPYNTNMSKLLHRKRSDRSWSAVEKRLGYDSSHEEIHLKPISVVLASTAQPLKK